MKKDKLQKTPEYKTPDDLSNDPTWEGNKSSKKGEKLTIKNRDGSESIITRNAIDDKDLAIILNSDQTQDQKTVAITNYLVSNNLDSLAFLGELFRTKGHLTKETREFKSQMRFDFEMFVATFITFLRDISLRLWKEMNSKYTIDEAIELYNKNKGDIRKVYPFWKHDRISFALIAISYQDQANHLEQAVKKITEQRERAMGKGIYVDKLGRSHSLYDEDIFSIIQKEKEELSKEKDDSKK